VIINDLLVFRMNGKMKKKNILLVANYPSDVGYAWWLMENFWASIGSFFYKKGFGVALVYPKLTSIPKAVETSPVDVCDIEISMNRFVQFVCICKIIIKKNIGYLYFTDRPYFGLEYFIYRVLGVKKIINHDHMPGERDKVHPLKWLLKVIIHKIDVFSCDKYIGVSEFIQKRAVEIACLPKSKCTYVHNGIEVFDGEKTKYVNAEFDIPIGAKIVVSTGRATFYKGIDSLIIVAKELIREKNFDDLYFLHLGDGPDLEAFKGLVQAAGIQERFLFGGFRKDVKRILPGCDIGIQLSHGEAFSLSIIEYLCAGLATLAPRHCGNAEAIDDGKNGLLFTPGDIEEIVEKMIYLLDNPSFATMLGKAGRQTVVDRFSIERCNEKLMALLDECFV